jgi:hypothetical protein
MVLRQERARAPREEPQPLAAALRERLASAPSAGVALCPPLVNPDAPVRELLTMPINTPFGVLPTTIEVSRTGGDRTTISLHLPRPDAVAGKARNGKDAL